MFIDSYSNWAFAVASNFTASHLLIYVDLHEAFLCMLSTTFNAYEVQWFHDSNAIQEAQKLCDRVTLDTFQSMLLKILKTDKLEKNMNIWSNR